MASDRQQFARAYSHWEKLCTDGHFSVPVEIGKTAIVSSLFTDEEPNTLLGDTELASFREEAKALAERIYQNGGTPELAIDASRNDITSLVQDPEVATMYVVGNGSLSTLILGIEERYDWYNAATETTHLKRGLFVQRQCGGLTRTLNVPLGLFVVSDPRNVFAAVGQDFYPLSLDDEENSKIQQVFKTPIITHSAIKDIARDDELQPRFIEEHEDLDGLNFLRLMRLASTLPKITTDDPRIPQFRETQLLPPLHGDNFYKRFFDLKVAYDGKATHLQTSYLRMSKERFGLDLEQFYRDNVSLCNSIYDVVMRLQPFEELTAANKKLLQMEAEGKIPIGKSEILNSATSHPLGINAIGIYLRDELNPLLELAYALLEDLTPNAPFYTR